MERMRSICNWLNQEQIIRQCQFSRSQIFEWRHEIKDRRARDCKMIPQQTVQNAVKVIMDYPHMGGRKGQSYMIYHRLGYISMGAYDRIKKSLGHLLTQEVIKHKLLPARTNYHHEKPQDIHEIWAEDFTDLVVQGRIFKLALLIDVSSQYYLGVAVSMRASALLVEKAVEQALEKNEGNGPKKFLLSDNGNVYVSDEHGRFLEKAHIVQKRIPACIPQYNGSVECGVKEFKNVFYNILAKQERKEADKEKILLSLVEEAVNRTAYMMNCVIPRPCLNGVTPEDVLKRKSKEKIKANLEYVRTEQEKPNPPPWEKSYWKLVEEAMALGKRSGIELLTKFCFFSRRPLRRITKLGLEGVG